MVNPYKGGKPRIIALTSKWSTMDTAPKDRSLIRVKTAFGERTARWHPNGEWVAGWADISFNDRGQPTAWRSQTEADNAADRERDEIERRKCLSKMKNSEFFLKYLENLSWSI